MKPILIFAFLLLTIALAAQNQCYRDLRKEGLSLLAKKDYRKAIDKLFAARYCPDKPAKDDLDELIKKTQDAWVKELNDTKKAAQDALQKLQAATAQTVTLFLKDIDQHILKLEYEQAQEKCAIALAFNSQKKEVVKRLQEVAFFYTETNQLARADSILQLLNNKFTPQERPVLLKTIQNLNISYYDTLQKRYYPEMVNVEGGTFMMGNNNGEENEKPAHQVTVSSFKMAQIETTVWQYNLFVEATNREIEVPGWGWWGDNPIVNVSWHDAIEYANWLSTRMNVKQVYNGGFCTDTIKTNWQANGFRLPTEAEWEFAARGGNLEKDKNYIYAGGNELKELGWYNHNSKNRTQPTAQKKPNALGLYDLTGNVWEWCWDWYATYPTSLSKGQEELSNTKDSGNEDTHVVRGGSWSDIRACRLSYRVRYFPCGGMNSSGFRLARY